MDQFNFSNNHKNILLYFMHCSCNWLLHPSSWLRLFTCYMPSHEKCQPLRAEFGTGWVSTQLTVWAFIVFTWKRPRWNSTHAEVNSTTQSALKCCKLSYLSLCYFPKIVLQMQRAPPPLCLLCCNSLRLFCFFENFSSHCFLSQVKCGF